MKPRQRHFGTGTKLHAYSLNNAAVCKNKVTNIINNNASDCAENIRVGMMITSQKIPLMLDTCQWHPSHSQACIHDTQYMRDNFLPIDISHFKLFMMYIDNLVEILP